MIAGPELLWLALNPGTTALRALRSLKQNKTPKKTTPQAVARVNPFSSLVVRDPDSSGKTP